VLAPEYHAPVDLQAPKVVGLNLALAGRTTSSGSSGSIGCLHCGIKVSVQAGWTTVVAPWVRGSWY